MNKPIEIKEYESIICDDDFADVDNYTCIPKKDFKDLVSFIHKCSGTVHSTDALDFMRVGYRRGLGEVVSFNNFVGLIQVRNGFQIQVLPKIDFSSGDDEGNKTTKVLFLKMLRSMKDFPSKVFNDASLKVDRMNLYEIFINMYIQEVRQLVKHGLCSGYIEREDNLNFFKGKLLVGKHIRSNLAHKERFFVGFEEFHQNRPENRLIKATLEKLQKITTSAENSKELRQLLGFFEMVEPSTAYEKDFSRVVINRNTKDYENLMKWSKVFLMNESFSTFSGPTNSKALLFPMESVYESYVAKEIRKVFGQYGWDVSIQDKGHFLFEKPEKKFALYPDIVLRRDNKTVIMDTKWKRLVPNEHINYGISQSDMYQMYAYSKKYHNPDDEKCPEVWLLYPLNKDMRGQESIFYDSGDNTIVRIHFVDLENIDKNLDELRQKIG